MLVKGTGVSGDAITAPLVVTESYEQGKDIFSSGDILVCHQTTKEMLPLVRKASGLILEDADPEGHGAIAGMSLDIPVIIGAKNATSILKTGAVVTMDGKTGTVSCN